MPAIEEQSKSKGSSEIRYLTPLNINTATKKKYCRFKRSGIKLGEMIVTGGYRVLSKELSHGTLVSLKNDPLSKDGNFGI